jgi:SAM-dependent methyltransferase
MQPSPGPAEFDGYASDYEALLRDPIRDTFAASRQFFFERKLHVIRRFYRRQAIDPRAVRWLDVGCGQGELLRLGQPDFKSAAGCDVSDGMLKHCRDLEIRRQPSPQELPFEGGVFDLVTAVCVYHHIPDNVRPLLTAEILRVLSPGGVFCIMEHNPLNPATRLIVARTPVDADAHLLMAGQAAKLLSSIGATFIETRYFLFLPQRLHQYLAGLEDLLSRAPVGGQYAVFASRP